MKKTKQLVLLFLMGLSIQVFAQKLRPHEIFRIKNLDSLIVMTLGQKEKVTALCKERKNKLTQTKDWYEIKDIDASTFTNILNVLPKEEQDKLIYVFLPETTKAKPYHTIVENFPKIYQKELLTKLAPLEEKENYLRARYIFDSYTMESKLRELIFGNRFALLKEEQIPLNKAIVKANKKKNCDNISEQEFEVLKAYEFYVLLNSSSNKSRSLDNLTAGELFKGMQEKLAVCLMRTSLQYIGNYYVGKDSITQQVLRDTIKTRFFKDISALVKNRKSLDVSGYSFKPFLVAKQTLGTLKNKKMALSKEEKKKNFFKKAEVVGIEKSKAKKVFDLILQRDKDLKSYKEFQAKNAAEYSLSISGSEQVKTPYKIKLQFAEDLTHLLSLYEYGELLSDEFQPQAKKNAAEDFKNLIKGNEGLKEEAKKELHLNRALIQSYYRYDRPVQQQKLGMITYRFEKEFQALVKKLNIKTGGSKAIDNNTFQWN